MFEPDTESRAAEVLARADRALLHHAGPFPDLVVDRASGTEVWDIDGGRYLDFTSGQLCATFGHNPAELASAMAASFQRTVHSSSHFVSDEVVALAEQLLALFPEPLRSGRVTLLTTGSESTEVALKVAKMATRRWETVGVDRSYHGHTAGAAAVTFLPRRRGSGPAQSGVYAIPAPYCFRCPIGAEPSTCESACIDVGFGAVDSQRTGDIAAVIVEPILSTGGVIEPPPGWFAHLRATCDERGIALIVDEAQTGLGRTGPMFCFEAHGVVPDAVCLSKSLGGGLPLAAVVMSEGLARGAEEAGFRFLTSHMNEPSMALVGLVMVDLARRHVEAGTGAVQGARLESGLRRLVDDVVVDVRGRGLLLGVEFGDAAAASGVADTCRRRGLLVQVVAERMWRVAPPITVTDAEIDRALAIISDALQAHRS